MTSWMRKRSSDTPSAVERDTLKISPTQVYCGNNCARYRVKNSKLYWLWSCTVHTQRRSCNVGTDYVVIDIYYFICSVQRIHLFCECAYKRFPRQKKYISTSMTWKISLTTRKQQEMFIRTYAISSSKSIRPPLEFGKYSSDRLTRPSPSRLNNNAVLAPASYASDIWANTGVWPPQFSYSSDPSAQSVIKRNT